MEKNKFKEIIQFAVDKEIMAFNFYNGVSQATKHSGAKELFSELAKEEEGHKRLLENLDMEKVIQARLQAVPNLKISDYMVDVEFKPDMPYADMIRLAMKMEERSLKLYTDMKESNPDEDLRKLFTYLAQQESLHKYRLEKIYDDEILK